MTTKKCKCKCKCKDEGKGKGGADGRFTFPPIAKKRDGWGTRCFGDGGERGKDDSKANLPITIRP